jgi:hypothetical protein
MEPAGGRTSTRRGVGRANRSPASGCHGPAAAVELANLLLWTDVRSRETSSLARIDPRPLLLLGSQRVF